MRAWLVERLGEYCWSSARGHLERCVDVLRAEEDPFARSIRDWRAYLTEGEPEEWRAALRRASLTGRPMSEGGFL